MQKENIDMYFLLQSVRSLEKIKGSTYKPKSGASKSNNHGQTHHR